MWHDWRADGSFWASLTETDEQIAEQVRRCGCGCGGRLHRADYPRKPRGLPGDDEKGYRRRISFCCDREGCRRRSTPPSVRFLGRRVYVAAMVIVAAICRIAEAVKAAHGVPARTVRRWCGFWQTSFRATAFWHEARGLLLPPVDESRLPCSLLERFAGSEPEERLKRLLRFLMPITTTSVEARISMRGP